MANGETEPTHSHDWVVRVAVCAARLDEAGIGIDFNDIKRMIGEVTAPFEGAQLEEIGCFKDVNVSAEVVAKYVYDRIKGMLPKQAKIGYAEVRESPGCWAKYDK